MAVEEISNGHAASFFSEIVYLCQHRVTEWGPVIIQAHSLPVPARNLALVMRPQANTRDAFAKDLIPPPSLSNCSIT